MIQPNVQIKYEGLCLNDTMFIDSVSWWVHILITKSLIMLLM